MSLNSILNNWVRKSTWFTEGDLKDCQKFWDGIPYELDVINLGSNSAKYGFDYRGLNVNAANLAMGPQCLLMDLNILKAYKDHLKPNAIVFIPMCPFSSMAGYNYLIDPKYHTFLPKENIPNFSKKTLARMMNLKNNPINSYPLIRLFVDIKNWLFKPFKKGNDYVNFDIDAQKWVNAWMNEFDIISFDDSLSVVNAKNKKDSATIIKSIYDFSKESGFIPFVVLPPVTSVLSQKLSTSMREKYIVDYIRQADIPEDHFLNYLDDKEIGENQEFFQNAYFLNADGAKVFTKKLLQAVLP